MYFKKIPSILTKSFPDVLWHKSREEKSVYLTFDDGPDPHSTPELLELLESFHIKATFFCLGENAEKYPDLVKRIRGEGHRIGAHGWKHLNGWKTSKEIYLQNAHRSLEYLETKLFRPPYGKLSWQQYQSLRRDCCLVFWDVMPGDFDHALNVGQLQTNLLQNVRAGSIIVLHDQAAIIEKLSASLKKCLPKLTESFQFSALSEF